MDRAFLRDVPLPAGVTLEGLFDGMSKTVDATPLRLQNGLDLSGLIQANTMSGIISNVFTVMLKQSIAGMSQPTNDTHFPDLRTGDEENIEIKATIRPLKGGEAHNGHAGWTVVAAYDLDKATGKIDFLTLSIARLEESDWRYLGSQAKAADKRVQRTETWTTTAIGTAKLRDGLAYWDPRVLINGARRSARAKIVELPTPSYSPFWVAPAA